LSLFKRRICEMPDDSSAKHDIIIAGAGIAAAFTALRLLDFGFRPLVLARRLTPVRGAEAVPESILRWQNVVDIAGLLSQAGAVTSEGFEVDLGNREPFVKPAPVFHVERTALARAALASAVNHGAALIYCEKLPNLNVADDAVTAVFENSTNKFQFAVDATGRRAFWSRPVARAGNEVAQLFRFPANGKLRGGKIVVTGRESWAYRIDLPEEITVGIVDKPNSKQNLFGDKRFEKLDLHATEGKFAGRRPAFPQWTVEPCRRRRIFAVGDAAFAHNPLAGQGIFFALSSAVALAAVLRTCRDLPENTDLALEYYRQLIDSERRRHLSFLKTFAAEEDLSENKKQTVSLTDFSPADTVRFSAPTHISGVQRDGFILPEETILLKSGGFARWLGEFDLLHLKTLCPNPVPLSMFLSSLEKFKLTPPNTQRLIQWCLTNGVLEISKTS